MKVLMVDCSMINNKTSSPHLGLAYIASQIKDFVDEIYTEGFYLNEGIKFSSLSDFLKAEQSFIQKIVNCSKSYDILMMSTTYATFSRVITISNAVKKVYPNILVIVGGPHISFLIQQEFNFVDQYCQMFDIIVEGEGEKTAVEMFLHIKQGKSVLIPGVTTRLDGHLQKCRSAPAIKNLDNIKEPAWDIFELSQYADYLRVLGSRGCIFKCTFCDTKKQWPNFRFRSAINVFKELKNNVERYGINTFRFVDPTFTAYPNLKELCQLIVDSQLNISFVAYAHVKTVNSKKIKYLKKAGCTALYYGIESGSDLILNGISKNSDVSEIIQAVNLTQEEGIKAVGSFILGLPKDTPETMMHTINFAKKLNCDIYSWHSYMPSLFDIVNDKNVKNYFDWNNLKLDFPKELIDEALESSQYKYLLDRHMITRYCQYGKREITSYPYHYSKAPNISEVIEAMKIAIAETTMKKKGAVDAVESLESFLEQQKGKSP